MSIIGRPLLGPRNAGAGLIAFRRLRFPFTFMGILGLAIGLWVVVYLAMHPGLDPGSRLAALGTGAVCVGFGAYVLIRRVRRGPTP